MPYIPIKSLLAICLFNSIILGSFGQTFSKTYSFDGQLENAIHCIENEDGFLLLGHATDEQLGAPLHRRLQLFQLDFNGSVLDSIHHLNDTLDLDAGARGALIEVENDSISWLHCSSAIHTESNKFVGVVSAYNDSLGIVWQKVFSHDSTILFRSILPLGSSEDKFIVVGETTKYTSLNDQMYAIGISIEGTILWEQNYGGSDVEFSSNALRIDENKNILSGITYSYANPHPHSSIFNAADAYFVCIDSLGNIIWENTNVGEGFDLYPIISQNGLFVHTIESPVTFLPSYDYDYIYAQFNLDNGNQLWVDTIQDEKAIQVNRIKQLSNDDLLLVYRIDDDSVSLGLTRMVRMDAQRNVIWTRTYATGDVDLAQITDFMEDEDGNLIFWGAIFYWEDYSTDMWLLKLNENGCLNDTDCGVVSGIIDVSPAAQHYQLSVSPNPSSNQVNISVLNSAKEHNKILNLVVYDMLGKKVYQSKQTVNGLLPIFNLDVSEWVNGNYLVVVSVNGEIKGSEQFIKE